MNQPIRLLIVDDDAWTVRAINAVFTDEPDFQVVASAHTGVAAVVEFRTHRPDIVLMDIHLGRGMSGIEATVEILRLDPKARVVVLSTIAPGPGLTRAIESGAVAVVHKDASEEDLLRKVKEAAAEESPILLKNLARELMVSDRRDPQADVVFEELTPRELATLMLICRGMSYEDIAAEQVVAVSTVKAHTKSLRRKLHASSLAQLVVRAVQLRYV